MTITQLTLKFEHLVVDFLSAKEKRKDDHDEEKNMGFEPGLEIRSPMLYLLSYYNYFLWILKWTY